jgi:hypothetical protein
MFGWSFHWKLYTGLFTALVAPLTILMLGKWLPTTSLPFAFMALLLFVRLMVMKDRDYLEVARKLSREVLRKRLGQEPKAGESEILAQQIVNSRQMVFYVIGVLQFAHLVLA